MGRRSVTGAYSTALIIVVLALSLLHVARAWALDALPLYKPVSIGNMLRAAYPGTGINSAVALNEHRDAVGRAIIENRYRAFIYTEAHGVQLLPGLDGFVNTVATDITERDLDGRVLIAGAAQLSSTERERALVWVYDALNGIVLETIDIGKPQGTDWSTATAVNNKGLVAGHSRAEGVTTPFRPILYDVRSRTLHELAIPFNPADINNSDVITGGTHRARLIDDGGVIRVGVVEDLRTQVSPALREATALNELNDVAGVMIMGYTDGAGRMVTGASRYRDGSGWQVLWSSSAFDAAAGMNNDGDVVGSIGISGAIRPFLYIEALHAGYLINDLVDPAYSSIYADYAAQDINNAGDVVAGASGAVLFVRTGDLTRPTAPANLTAVPHEPTWQQPWIAITLSWENTSALTKSYSLERRRAGAVDWTEILANWVNTSHWDRTVEPGVIYEYRVRARGFAGYSDYSNIAGASAPGTVVDTVPPQGRIVAPEAGTQVSGSVQIVVEASDNVALRSVEIGYASGAASGRICLEALNNVRTATVSCTWNTRKLEPGNYTLTATISDEAGNTAVAAAPVTLIQQPKGGGKNR